MQRADSVCHHSIFDNWCINYPPGFWSLCSHSVPLLTLQLLEARVKIMCAYLYQFLLVDA